MVTIEKSANSVTPKIFYLLITSIVYYLMFSGCTPQSSNEVYLPYFKSIVLDGTEDSVYHINTTGAVDLTLRIDANDSTADLYFIFTNPSNKETDGSLIIDPLNSPLLNTTGIQLIDRFYSEPVRLGQNSSTDSRSVISPLLSGIGEDDTIGDTQDFIVIVGDIAWSYIPATCRGVVKVDDTSLNVWVKDDVWGIAPGKIDQTDIDALTSKFLNGTGDDIYTWVTNIYGEQWGKHNFPNDLIPDNNAITILVDNSMSAYILGYFNPRNNYLASNYPGETNERIMFCVNSDYLGSIDPQKKDLIYSTLVHEFQHMIHFYQKFVLRSSTEYPAVWLNELCSLATEDIIAGLLGVDNPADLRISDYNKGTGVPLTEWTGDIKNYGVAYSYGAYLVRNFNGPSLLRNIVRSSSNGSQALTDALKKSGFTQGFGRSLDMWGASVLLSDKDSPINGFSSKGGLVVYNGINYNTDTINYFDYFSYYDSDEDKDIYGPLIIPINNYIKTVTPLNPSTNTFYSGGEIDGVKEFRFRYEDGVRLTLIVK